MRPRSRPEKRGGYSALPILFGGDKITSMRFLPAMVFAMLVLSGCAGEYSTGKEMRTAYAVSRDQAKEIVESSMLAHLSHDYINPSPIAGRLACSGYIRSILDTTTINAVAVSAIGATSNGQKKEGFTFGVNYSGTIWFPSTPGRVFKTMVERASQSGESLSIK